MGWFPYLFPLYMFVTLSERCIYFFYRFILALVLVYIGNGGWSGGAKVLGKLPVPGHPTTMGTVGQGPTALAVGAGGGCLDIFTVIYHFSFLSPSLWETARYRLKYCLKGPLSPKQTNQTFIVVFGHTCFFLFNRASSIVYFLYTF